MNKSIKTQEDTYFNELEELVNKNIANKLLQRVKCKLDDDTTLRLDDIVSKVVDYFDVMDDYALAELICSTCDYDYHAFKLNDDYFNQCANFAIKTHGLVNVVGDNFSLREFIVKVMCIIHIDYILCVLGGNNE